MSKENQRQKKSGSRKDDRRERNEHEKGNYTERNQNDSVSKDDDMPTLSATDSRENNEEHPVSRDGREEQNEMTTINNEGKHKTTVKKNVRCEQKGAIPKYRYHQNQNGISVNHANGDVFSENDTQRHGDCHSDTMSAKDNKQNCFLSTKNGKEIQNATLPKKTGDLIRDDCRCGQNRSIKKNSGMQGANGTEITKEKEEKKSAPSRNNERPNDDTLGNNDRVLHGRDLQRRIGPIGPRNAPSTITLGSTIPCPYDRPPVIYIASLAHGMRLSRTVTVWVWPH